MLFSAPEIQDDQTTKGEMIVKKEDGIILKVKVKDCDDCDDTPKYQWYHDGHPITTGTYAFIALYFKGL